MEKALREEILWAFFEMKRQTEKISICGKKSYFYINVRPLVHNNSEQPTDGCRTDFADIQNKKECGGNRQWQNHYLRNWAANTKGKGII